MATETIVVSALIAAKPKMLYDAWMDGDTHAAFTGAPATSDPRVGGAFTAWDGYIRGTHLEVARPHRVVEAWRTTEFPADAADSKLIVLFDNADGGTRLTFVHTDIPSGQGARYESGWVDYYVKPLRKFLAANVRKGTMKKKAPSKKTVKAAKR